VARVVVDGYTYNAAIESPANVKIGTTFILECSVAGLPFNTLVEYNWTYPHRYQHNTRYNNVNVIEARKLRVTVMDEQDGGMYVCSVHIKDRKKFVQQKFHIAVDGGAILLSDHGIIHENTVITNRSVIQRQHRPFNSGGFNIGVVYCIAPKNSSPQFVTIKHNKDNNISENLHYHGSGEPDTPFKQKKNSKAAMLLIGDPDNTENTKFCCESSHTRVCAYLWLQRKNDTRHINVTLKRKKLELRITPYPTNLVMLTHSVHGLSKTMLVKKQHMSVGELFPGAEYIVAVRGIRVRRDRTEYSLKPYVLKVTKNLTSQDEPLSTPRLLSVTRVFTDGVEINWLPPDNYTPSHYTVRCSTNTTNITLLVSHYPGSMYANITGLTSAEKYHIKVAARANRIVAASEEIVHYHYPQQASNTNSPAPDSLAATLPIIAILVVLLITAVAASIIASKVKSHQKERKTSAKQKKRGALPHTPPNRGRVDDENIYEKFNWENKIFV
jgi:hypothetical protein